jgi:8-oxo-dGTP pyrophosphatase MutT (NUDIX family)
VAHGGGRGLLEIPAGTLDVHDGVTEDPDVAARRELEEETGHRAARWRKLAEFWTAPGFATELMHLYLATGIAGADADGRLEPDEDERLELRAVPLDEAVGLVLGGTIRDAKSILGILWLERLRRAGSSSRRTESRAERDDPRLVVDPTRSTGSAGLDHRSTTATSAPPSGRFRAQTRPFIADARARTAYSPMPAPGALRAADGAR